MKPSEIKASLLAQLASAPVVWLLDIPFAAPRRYDTAGNKRLTDEQIAEQRKECEKQRLILGASVGYLTLQAGPCTLTVLNTQAHRERARQRIAASPGFKDGSQKYRAPGRFTVSAQALTAEEVAQAHRDYLADTPVEDLC